VPYKLLAVDCDGTLLRRDGSIHPVDQTAIQRLDRELGVPITIATGRLYSGTRDVARKLQLSGPIACVDGSHIVNLDDDVALFYQAITGDHAAGLREVLGRHGPATFVFADDAIVHDDAGHPFVGYVKTWSSQVSVVASVTEHPSWEHELGVMAVAAVGVEADIAAAADELRARFEDAMRVVTFPVHRIRRHAMLVRAAGPTKGTAIRFLAQHHRCTVGEVVVVGDWLNDVPMFEVAGRSFVMGQAPPFVKASATDHLQADCFKGGGIAEAIWRAWGI
jgi:hypothetical protein